MSLYDYTVSQDIAIEDHPFYALIMAAMRKADDYNAMLLRAAFPEVWDELSKRYSAPGGLLKSDPEFSAMQRNFTRSGLISEIPNEINELIDESGSSDMNSSRISQGDTEKI